MKFFKENRVTLLGAIQPEDLLVEISEFLSLEALSVGRQKNKFFLQQLLQPRQMFNPFSNGDASGQIRHLALSLLRQEPVIEKDRRVRVRRMLHQRQQIGLSPIGIE